MTNHYFLGGTSAAGFQTRFQEVIREPGYFTYILKGGPGTGKSTLMKRLASYFSEGTIDAYRCSSDLHSLDAVVLHEKKVIIVDGTAPHIFQPEVPGVAQTLVDLGAHWDQTKLVQEEMGIRRCLQENARYHRRARSFVTALTAVKGSIYEQAFDRLQHQALARAFPDLLDTLLKEVPGEASGKASGKIGTVSYRQLSAITTEGYYSQKPPKGTRQFWIYDPWYGAGIQILTQLREAVSALGYDVQISDCVLFPTHQLEHLSIPSLNCRFSLISSMDQLTAAASENPPVQDERPVSEASVSKNKNSGPPLDCRKFYDLGEEESALWRAAALAISLEKEAADSIRKALEIHDQLEAFYIGALDFEALDGVAEKLIHEIRRR